MFDALENRTDQILTAVQSVTNLPITTIVYSHNHADHIGGALTLLEKLNKMGIKPKIVASKATVDKQAYLQSKLPPSETSHPLATGII